MKKLKLNLEDLKVESFETTKKDSQMGTVHGFETGDTACLNCPETYMIHTCVIPTYQDRFCGSAQTRCDLSCIELCPDTYLCTAPVQC